MMIPLLFLVAMLVGYLLGSANSSLIVSRCLGVDVRRQGSGNAGATNSLRVLGKRAAVIASIGDVAKGMLAYCVGSLLLRSHPQSADLGGLAAGCAAVVGHNWPIYFGFQGGKGIWTSFAVVSSFDWRIGVSLVLLFAALILLFRRVSLGAVGRAICLPWFPLWFGDHWTVTLVFVGLALLAVYRHRTNIKRLLGGQEPKIGE